MTDAWHQYLPSHEVPAIEAILTDALAAGYAIEVYGENELDLQRTTNRADIVDLIGITSETTLFFYPATGRTRTIGSVLLVHGNEPGVVIADYTDNEATRAILARAEAIQDAQA